MNAILSISENYTFRKTEELRSRSFGEPSPLITVQDLLLRAASSKGTSQQGSNTQPDDGVCPLSSTGMEGVDVGLPRMA